MIYNNAYVHELFKNYSSEDIAIKDDARRKLQKHAKDLGECLLSRYKSIVSDDLKVDAVSCYKNAIDYDASVMKNGSDNEKIDLIFQNRDTKSEINYPSSTEKYTWVSNFSINNTKWMFAGLVFFIFLAVFFYYFIKKMTKKSQVKNFSNKFHNSKTKKSENLTEILLKKENKH
ncbi:uncharacterized protein VNE69_04168 [Vairimorpha necatrix]|uniref:Membrane protein n=1 Tax=Vairimorpha necatrix TaxID=6039 RepID=A0AAX4JBI7_9MICR